MRAGVSENRRERRRVTKIVIISGQHASQDPRAVKEADVLHAAGLRVEMLGVWSEPSLAKADQRLLDGRGWTYTPVVDCRAGVMGPWPRFRARVAGRLARDAYRRLGIQSPALLGPAAQALLAAARERDAALTIGHKEIGLWACCRLMDEGRRAGVDFEDWYSEDLLPDGRVSRPVAWLRRMEQRALSLAPYRMCASHAMSRALAEAYQCAPPDVMWNVFPWADRKTLDGKRLDRRDSAMPSICWHSKTLGPGRGLEDLIAALPRLQVAVEVHLRGNASNDYVQQLLRPLAPELRARVFVHPPAAPGELLSRVAEHDIGLAAEQTYCRSRELTITYKLCQYPIAGLAVVASDTPGQREGAEQIPGGIVLYSSGSPESLADALRPWLLSADALATAKAAALRAAEHSFCLERQATGIVEAVERALSHDPDRDAASRARPISEHAAP